MSLCQEVLRILVTTVKNTIEQKAVTRTMYQTFTLASGNKIFFLAHSLFKKTSNRNKQIEARPIPNTIVITRSDSSFTIFPLVCIILGDFLTISWWFYHKQGRNARFFAGFWKDMAMILRCAFLFDYCALIDYY
jgi:hypothetical protein